MPHVLWLDALVWRQEQLRVNKRGKNWLGTNYRPIKYRKKIFKFDSVQTEPIQMKSKAKLSETPNVKLITLFAQCLPTSFCVCTWVWRLCSCATKLINITLWILTEEKMLKSQTMCYRWRWLACICFCRDFRNLSAVHNVNRLRGNWTREFHDNENNFYFILILGSSENIQRWNFLCKS